MYEREYHSGKDSSIHFRQLGFATWPCNYCLLMKLLLQIESPLLLLNWTKDLMKNCCDHQLRRQLLLH